MASGGGQIPVFCKLCEEDTKSNWKCLNCDMFMCDKCKEKIHVKFKFAKDHKVVSIQEVGLHAEEIDFSNLSCKTHTRQSCVMFCKSCDCLVCPLCISETHNGHGLVSIREGYEIRMDKLKKSQKNIGHNIDELKKRKAEVDDVENTEHSKLENTIKEMDAQKTALKNEIDTHIDKLNSEIMKRWEALHQSTKKEGNEVTRLIGSLESRKSEVYEVIQSTDAEKVFEDDLGLVKSMELTLTSSRRKFDSIPTFLPGQISPYNIGTLANVFTKSDIKIRKQFDTKLSHIYFMATCSEDTLWISDSNVLHKVKIERKTVTIIDAKDIKIYDMACTPSKDLLIVSKGSALKEISGETGEVTNSKYKVKDLLLSAVHVSSDGKVTVGGFQGKLCYPPVGRRAVIVMDRNGKHETTYEYDKQGNPIFTNICNITRTKNGNICIVDRLSKDARGRVVILSEDGDVLNTFNGHPEENYSFQPMHSFTAISESIIVSNLSHSILYFLNNSGNFIGWCDTNKKGILHPYSFSSTKAGYIYFGCTTPEGSSDNAKIYEVNIL